MPSLLYIKAFGQGSNPRSRAAKLPCIFQNDLRPPIVFLNLSPHVDGPPGELPHIANIFQIIRKHNYAKGAEPVVFAKIKIVDSASASLHANHFSRDALVFANMFSRLIK